MRTILLRLGLLALILVVILMLGTIGFMVLESRSPFEALYFSMVTIATVGYGDITPVTTGGRILAMFIIVTGVGTFTTFLLSIGGLFLERRENKVRQERMNVLIDLFYSEIGNHLLELLSRSDANIGLIREKISVTTEWQDEQFKELRNIIQVHKYELDKSSIELPAIKAFLQGKTDLLMRLLENPSLIEHELFTNLLRATFHLREELVSRQELVNCVDSDKAHLTSDAKRVYGMLLQLWFRYISDLKKRYPYLFSYAIRNNPLNEKRSVIVI
jgi:voltage-gated potassium channel